MDKENLEQELQQIKQIIIEQKELIAQKSIATSITNKKEAVQLNKELIDVIIRSVDNDFDLEAIERVARAVGLIFLDMDYKLEEAIQIIQKVRQSAWEKNEAYLLKIGISPLAILRFSQNFNVVFNHYHTFFCKAFIEMYEERIKVVEDEFLLLSAPVVPILDGVAIIPFVGRIDEKRAELLMQKALEDATRLALTDVFIDLSGVAIINQNIAYHIFKIVEALEVIGVNVVLVGIRPETSQTMVHSGIHFEDIKTYHSLQQALVREQIIKLDNNT